MTNIFDLNIWKSLRYYDFLKCHPQNLFRIKSEQKVKTKKEAENWQFKLKIGRKIWNIFAGITFLQTVFLTGLLLYLILSTESKLMEEINLSKILLILLFWIGGCLFTVAGTLFASVEPDFAHSLVYNGNQLHIDLQDLVPNTEKETKARKTLDVTLHFVSGLNSQLTVAGVLLPLFMSSDPTYFILICILPTDFVKSTPVRIIRSCFNTILMYYWGLIAVLLCVVLVLAVTLILENLKKLETFSKTVPTLWEKGPSDKRANAFSQFRRMYLRSTMLVSWFNLEMRSLIASCLFVECLVCIIASFVAIKGFNVVSHVTYFACVALAICEADELMTILPMAANFFENSNEILKCWKRKLNSRLARMQLRSLKPLRAEVGPFLTVSKETTMTIWLKCVDHTIDLLMSINI